MTETKGKLIYLDLHRRNWTVGFIYCGECQQSNYQMWVTGAELIDCPSCGARIYLSLDPNDR